MPHGSSRTVSILQVDSGLGSDLDPASRRRAGPELQADALILEPGSWNPPGAPPEPGYLGLLIVDGLMTRHLEVEGAHCVELLSNGDLLRPWQEDAASFVRARWRVLQRTEVAMLTAEVAARLCRYPPVIGALIERTMNRSRSLAVFSAIDNVIGVERRLRLLLWHLAERWGRVEIDGVVMPLELTHQMLADLVGSRRPSVTTALKRLADAGEITQDADGGWRLQGSPPGLSADGA
jgi:hypothetical protein